MRNHMLVKLPVRSIFEMQSRGITRVEIYSLLFDMSQGIEYTECGKFNSRDSLSLCHEEYGYFSWFGHHLI
jgi:hypothetical protein